MGVQIRGRNIEVTDALKEYVNKRLRKLEKYIDNLGEAQVTLSVVRSSSLRFVRMPYGFSLLYFSTSK